MTMRERMLAVIQGREHDRVPFVQYSGLGAPDDEIWPVVGRENMGIIRWSAVHRLEHPHCRFVSEETAWNGRRGERTTLFTPRGSLVEEKVFDPAFGSAARRKHFVEKAEDYEALLAYLRDIVVVDDVEQYRRDDRATGDDGLPMVAVRRTPYQQMWILWASLEDFSLHRADYPDLTEECLNLLADIERRIFHAVIRALDRVDIPLVDFPDNITAPCIGVDNFRRYCIPLYDELAEMLSERNIPVFVHMDGDLKPLWSAIGASGVRGLDSLSPPPDNDTRPADAVALWPEMRLFVNFPSSVHLDAPEAVYEHARRILDEAGHTGRLQIQISENTPPDAWRNSYPAIIRAIRDFGKP